LAPLFPGGGDLRALAAKYRQLADLRARRDASQTTGRETLRALAAEYPGCLRELDTLGLPELMRRARAAEAAAQGGAGPGEPEPQPQPEPQPWLAWIWGYHRLMKATLQVKRAVGRTGLPEGEERRRLLEEATRQVGWPLDDDFLDEVAHPPQGRIGVLVLRRLGRVFGRPAAEIARTLFPPRRASPYTLG
jgi:hypothetical protein